MHTLLNYLGILLGMSLLMVFVWGACRHVVHQVITRHPRLAEATPQAKAQKYALASVQVLWNILVPMVTILFGFFGAMAEHEDAGIQVDSDGDYRYRHEGEKYYTHTTSLGGGKTDWTWY